MKNKKPVAGVGAAAVDAYLARLPDSDRGALIELRKQIRSAAPAATERISYQVPAFFYQGRLVFYAAFRDHLSFWTASLKTQRTFAKELARFASGKGTLRFTAERPIPPALIRRIVRARVAENEANAKARRSRPRAPRTR